MNIYQRIIYSSIFTLKDAFNHFIPYRWLRISLIILSTFFTLLLCLGVLVVILSIILDFSGILPDHIDNQQRMFRLENFVNIQFDIVLILISGSIGASLTYLALNYYIKHRLNLITLLYPLIPIVPIHVVTILITPFIILMLFPFLFIWLPYILFFIYFQPFLSLFTCLSAIAIHIWSLTCILAIFNHISKKYGNVQNYREALNTIRTFIFLTFMILSSLPIITNYISFNIVISQYTKMIVMLILVIISCLMLPIILKKTCHVFIQRLIQKTDNRQHILKSNYETLSWSIYQPWIHIKRDYSIMRYMITLFIMFICLFLIQYVYTHLSSTLAIPTKYGYGGLNGVLLILIISTLLTTLTEIEKKQPYRLILAPYSYLLQRKIFIYVGLPTLMLTTIAGIIYGYGHWAWVGGMILSSLSLIIITILIIKLNRPFIATIINGVWAASTIVLLSILY